MKHFESFGLDTSNQCLWHNGVQIALPPKPFAVLRYLVENPSRLITHNELLDALWPETYVQPQVLRTYVLDLRKLLGDDAGQPRFIQTVPKRGYRFVAAVIERSVRSVPSSPEPNGAPSPAAQPEATEFLTEIVGRTEQLAHLHAQLGLAAAGQRRVVFVTGEAGIGKTALVDTFCRRLGVAMPVGLARGQCVEGFAGKEEYYPVMEALAQLCASPDGDHACRILARMAPVWLAALRREPEGSNQSTPQDRMPGDLCAALEELAADKPLVLVFEDLHWADEATIHLVSALARRRASAKLMLLATCRLRSNANGANGANGSSAEHPLKALKQDLLMRRLCAEIALPPLPRTAVSELISRELQQQSLPSGLAAFVHQHSEGNPLFAIAILEHLIAQGYLVREASRATSEKHGSDARWEQHAPLQEMEASIPDGLAQMIELEIERLTPQEQRLLEAASLINVAFPAWAVAAALDEDCAETEEACDALARRLYFVQRAGQDELPDGTCSAFYAFAHELYREVLYRRQSSTRRARRHIRVAERLATLFAGREAIVAREMATHYEAAGDWPRAIDALRAAASHAHQRHSDAQAAELLEHAMRIAANLSDPEREPALRDIHRQLDNAHPALAQPSGRRPKLPA